MPNKRDREILGQQIDQATVWMRRALQLASLLQSLGHGDEARRILRLSKRDVSAELLRLMDEGKMIEWYEDET